MGGKVPIALSHFSLSLGAIALFPLAAIKKADTQVLPRKDLHTAILYWHISHFYNTTFIWIWEARSENCLTISGKTLKNPTESENLTEYIKQYSKSCTERCR